MMWAKWTIFVFWCIGVAFNLFNACYGKPKTETKNTPGSKMESIVFSALSGILGFCAGSFPWGFHA